MEFRKTEKEGEGSRPLSPIGQYLSSSVLSLYVLGVLESEVPIDDSLIMLFLKDVFLSIDQRFSSIMVPDKNGIKHWKNVEVNLNEHVNMPIFCPGMSPKFYDECLDDYLSKLCTEQFPQTHRPLWEIHIIKYPTTNAAGNLIFKFHHVLGDGYSLMAGLISCLQRADNPSIPLTFPSVRIRSNTNSDDNSIFGRVSKFFSSAFNTISGFCGSIIKSRLNEDDLTPIRSGNAEFQPMTISTMAFSLRDIKQIKDNLGVSINDLITGVIFFGTRLYMQAMGQEYSSNTNSTASVLLNTRTTRSYKSVKEMIKPDSKSPWGNHFAFLDVPICKLTKAEFSDPLEFVRNVQKIILRKRSSSSVYLTRWFMEAVNKVRGSEAAAKYWYGTLKNSSMPISNMIGTEEKMALANHPVKGLYFMVVGSPQSLIIAIVSYNGNLRLAIGAEKDFIDPKKFKTCIENAYEIILKAACEPAPYTKSYM